MTGTVFIDDGAIPGAWDDALRFVNTDYFRIKEYRPQSIPMSRHTSGNEGRPPEGTSGAGQAGEFISLRMAFNGDYSVSRSHLVCDPMLTLCFSPFHEVNNADQA